VKNSHQNIWSMVLAAGDGTRLAALTTGADGNPVPKQFCSLTGEGSLLQGALDRGMQVALRERVCTIVSEQHRRHWQPMLAALPQENIIVQPRNCGTANGVLLSLLCTLNRDPLAKIVFLPADHYVQDEDALASGLGQLVEQLGRHSDELLLLGIEPDEADPELGYIVPGQRVAPGVHDVVRFVEKPSVERARMLLQDGAMWNSFIFAAQGATLLGLMRERMPIEVDAMETALARDALHPGSAALAHLYERLSPVDFSHAIVQGAEQRLRVIGTAPCGWTDLGTPQRVIETLRRQRPAVSSWRRAIDMRSAVVNLASQRALLQLAG
jgi:mannose-1-phosphate guanylyltransferase